MIFIGIDPGAVSGAWGIIDNNGFIDCGDIPVKNFRIDALSFYNILLDHTIATENAIVACEDVHLMPKQGIASGAKFMRAAGAIEAVCSLTMFNFVLISPQKWKRHHNLIGQDKLASLELARSFYPDAKLKLKKHHGRAESLLIAKFLQDTK